MLLCSRTHIPPNLLLNKLARLTINSITSLTRVCEEKINFLSIFILFIGSKYSNNE